MKPDTGDTSLSSWELLIAYFQASQTAEFFPSNATFEELQSAGDLELVRNADLRSALSEYYAYPGVGHLRERPRYREHIRSILPARIQKYIWLNCYGTDGALQVLKACPSPITQTDAEAIVDRLKIKPNTARGIALLDFIFASGGLDCFRLTLSLPKELRDELYQQLDSHVEKRPL